VLLRNSLWGHNMSKEFIHMIHKLLRMDFICKLVGRIGNEGVDEVGLSMLIPKPNH